MKQEIVAPWAEPVPDAPYPMTIAQMQALPDDAWQYELVDGTLVRMPGSGNKASAIAAILIGALVAFVRPRRLGRVSSPDGEYSLTLPGAATEAALIPDVAFVRAGRLPALDSPAASAIPQLAPDLVVEVAFPHQGRDDLAAKARRYLDAGVRPVWVVWTDDKQVDVWRPGSDASAATLREGDTLDSFDVLPGFAHPISDLFTE